MKLTITPLSTLVFVIVSQNSFARNDYYPFSRGPRLQRHGAGSHTSKAPSQTAPKTAPTEAPAQPNQPAAANSDTTNPISLNPEELSQIYLTSFSLSQLQNPELALEASHRDEQGNPVYFRHPWSKISKVDPNEEEHGLWMKAENFFMPLIESYLHERQKLLDSLVDVESEKLFAQKFLKSALKDQFGVDFESRSQHQPLQTGMIADYMEYQSRYFQILVQELQKIQSPYATRIELRAGAIDALRDTLAQLQRDHRENWSKLKP